MLSFISKLLFLMLIVVYSSQYGFHVSVIIFLYCVAMVINIVIEAIVRLKVDDLLGNKNLSLEDSIVLDFICRDVSIPLLWTVFFAFMNVIFIFFSLGLSWFAAIVALSGLNSVMHLQYLEKSVK